jgi:hypothetical protein
MPSLLAWESFFQDRADDWARNRLMRLDNRARKQTKPMQESESQDEENMMIAAQNLCNKTTRLPNAL